MPTPTEEFIAKYTVTGSSTAAYTFNSIPNNYTDLILVIVGSNTTASNVAMQFNGDTATNYSNTVVYGYSGTAYSARNTNNAAVVMASISSTAQSIIINNFMNYSNTTTYKTVLQRGSSDVFVRADAGLWRSTSAINSIYLYNYQGGYWTSGTTFSLYGVL